MGLFVSRRTVLSKVGPQESVVKNTQATLHSHLPYPQNWICRDLNVLTAFQYVFIWIHYVFYISYSDKTIKQNSNDIFKAGYSNV